VADRETIRRVAKILARATSPEPEEAAAALSGAYKRMVRDSVTLQDLLSLPVAELYQNTLVRLAEVIIADIPDLSPSERREAYSAYLVRIVAKFSNASPKQRAGIQTSRRRRRGSPRASETKTVRDRGSPRGSRRDKKPGKRENSRSREGLHFHVFGSALLVQCRHLFCEPQRIIRSGNTLDERFPPSAPSPSPVCGKPLVGHGMCRRDDRPGGRWPSTHGIRPAHRRSTQNDFRRPLSDRHDMEGWRTYPQRVV
jgi:hypothetical protein